MSDYPTMYNGQEVLAILEPHSRRDLIFSSHANSVMMKKIKELGYTFDDIDNKIDVVLLNKETTLNGVPIYGKTGKIYILKK